MSHKRYYTKNTAGEAGRCPEPCGKTRFLTRKDARREAARHANRLRAYSGDDPLALPSCTGYWHLASYAPQARVAFYRERTREERARGDAA